MIADEKERRDLLTILRSTPETLHGMVRGLSDSESRRRRDPPDEWSVSEIATHLVDTEVSWLERRVRMMKEQDCPYMPYYPDVDYSKPTLADSVMEFSRRRRESLAYLEGLEPDDWERGGTHERWGPVTILWAVRHIAAHDAEHLAQLGRRVIT